jgi:hypothetical protein
MQMVATFYKPSIDVYGPLNDIIAYRLLVLMKTLKVLEIM